jgi:nucleotide-binding universal stress UspA family protein
MGYRTVLVHVDPEPSRGDLVRAAGSVAELFEATLLGVGAAALDQFLEPAVRHREPPVRRALREEIQGDLRRAEETFRDLAGPPSDKMIWRAMAARPLDAVARSAAGADLVVAGRAGNAALDIGALVMAAGLPVLAAPAGRDRLSAESVVVGWKNTRETRRALSDSLPFLKRAKQVRVAAAVEDALDVEVAAELEDVALRLERHGVRAAVEMRTDGQSAAQMLIEVAERDGADLIVAGAYGHSRMHQWAFGGVTRSLLGAAPAFVLFSR